MTPQEEALSFANKILAGINEVEGDDREIEVIKRIFLSYARRREEATVRKCAKFIQRKCPISFPSQCNDGIGLHALAKEILSLLPQPEGEEK